MGESGRSFECEWPELAGQLHAMLSHKGIPRFKREDLVQETGLRLFKMWSNVDPDRPVWPLAVTIALNLVRDEARRRPQREILGDIPEHASQDDVERLGLARMELSRVCKAIADLSPAHRSVLLLEWGQQGEIAQRGAAATKMLRLRARRKLHAVLESASAGSIVVVFRFRRLLEMGGQFVFGRGVWSGGQNAASGALVMAALMIAGLPGNGFGSLPQIPGEIQAPDRTVVAALDGSDSIVSDFSLSSWVVRPRSGNASVHRLAPGHGTVRPRGATPGEESSSFDVPLPTNGRLGSEGTVQVAGYGASVGKNGGGGTPVCVNGVQAYSVSCQNQQSGTKVRAKVYADPGPGDPIEEEVELAG